MTVYYLIPIRVSTFSAGMLGVKETTLPPAPPPPTHSVHYNNAAECSLAGSKKPDGTPLTGIPTVNQLVNLALSTAFCSGHGISTAGREKFPMSMDANGSSPAEVYSLRVAEIESLVLTLKNGKSIDLNNPPLCVPESLHFDAEGQWSVLLTERGKQLLALPGLLKHQGPAADFQPALGSPTPRTFEPEKVRAFMSALATLLE